jgi:hypothetical protein
VRGSPLNEFRNFLRIQLEFLLKVQDSFKFLEKRLKIEKGKEFLDFKFNRKNQL